MKKTSKLSLVLSAVLMLVIAVTMLPARGVSAKSGDAKATSISFKTTTGGDFVAGVSKMKITFKLDAAAQNVKLNIVDSDDEVVFTKTFKSCKKKKAVSFTWNGKNTKGKKYVSEGIYSVEIIAGKSSTRSDELDVAKGSFKLIRKSGFAGGDGSEKKPYQVKNLVQLKKVEENNGKFFKQTADIDIDYEDFSGMFGEKNQFVGSYDGNDHIISNAILVEGLFHFIGEGGEVKNLTVTGCNVTGNYTGVICHDNFGTIKKCKVASCNISQGSSTKSQAGLGGIACGNFGKINNCEVTGLVASDSEKGTFVGGICGDNQGNVIQCKVSNIDLRMRDDSYTWDPYTRVGGLCGKNSGNVTYSSVENANLVGQYVGVLVGDNSGVISGCTPASAETGLVGIGNAAV